MARWRKKTKVLPITSGSCRDLKHPAAATMRGHTPSWPHSQSGPRFSDWGSFCCHPGDWSWILPLDVTGQISSALCITWGWLAVPQHGTSRKSWKVNSFGTQATLKTKEMLFCDPEFSVLSLSMFFLCFRHETVRKQGPQECILHDFLQLRATSHKIFLNE